VLRGGTLERPFEAYRGDEPYVFVCYSHDDKAVVYQEIAWLHEQGVNVWYDEGISPGEEWSEELGQAIDGAHRVLYFVSPRSVASRHCRNELNFSQNHHKSILSVYLEDTELPSGVELVISASQAILKPDMSEADYRAKLLRTLGRPAEQEGIRSPPGIRLRPRRIAFWVLVLACLGALIGLWDHFRPEPRAFDRSVVLRPLSVVGDDRATNTYAGALGEELRTAVARYQELRTVAANGGVPEGTEASYVLDGNVQPLGERLRLRVSLTRTADREMVWSETFDRPLAEVVADPATMASTVARFIRLRLIVDHQCETVRRHTTSEEAAAAYCAAVEESYRFSQGGASDQLLVGKNAQRALALDPTIADAYNMVAESIGGRAFGGAMDWREAAVEAHALTDQGLALAPNDARLLYRKGCNTYYLDLNYEAAKEFLTASLDADALHPDAYSSHFVLGLIALTQGNVAEALEHASRALHLNDADSNVYLLNAGALTLAGHYRDAIEAADAGLELVQTGANRTYLVILKAGAQEALGELEAANATVDDGLATVGRDLNVLLAGSLAKLGRTEEARALIADLESLEQPSISALWALVGAYATLDPDHAFELIHESLDRHSIPLITTLRWLPAYAYLREDPRWDEVMAHLAVEEAKARAGHNRQS